MTTEIAEDDVPASEPNDDPLWSRLVSAARTQDFL